MYYKGQINSGGAGQLSGKYGKFCAIEMSSANGGTMAKVKSRGKTYALFLTEGQKGGFGGTRMFKKVVVQVAINGDGETCHVWIKSLYSRPKRGNKAPYRSNQNFNRNDSFSFQPNNRY